jgi:major vault protein
MADPRDTDLVLAPNEFVFISDLNTGLIRPLVGPTKKTLDSTEQPVIFDTNSKRFTRCAPKDAVQLFPVVDERSYLILENPAEDADKEHPTKGQDNAMPKLQMGQKKNIPGPATFPLWPGQVATVIEGHQLRSNQYLRCVVHNAKEAMENWGNAVVDTTQDSQEEGITKQATNLVTGQILIIKGTEVSYYIPPTGINVVPEGDDLYVRDAVTLERLEYCILLDESGEKRYVKGPCVVFPKPTEAFVEKEGDRKFLAIELNENMGIYLKVIADYEEEGTNHLAGEEIFITGKDLKIYYPRAEHAIIKYDGQVRHHAIAIPKGEARYVLNKDTGEIQTVKGPLMFMPDPRKEVVVRRVLGEREVGLWFPGNQTAVIHNQRLRETLQDSGEGYARYMSSTGLQGATGPRGLRGKHGMPAAVFAAASLSHMDEIDYSNSTVTAGDDVERQNKFTPPRMITLDTKYDGGVNINVWPGYAVQVVSKNGDRRVVIGPKSCILEYDETLEVLELSTGKPKSDSNMFRTVYLRVKNNRVSDLVEADTRDMVGVQARVNYRVNFEGDSDLWFSTENYVKFLTQNMRSIIRNEIQKHGIEEVSQNITQIIRDVVLGVTPESTDGGPTERSGHSFPENGMRVYDVEVLSLQIGDDVIRQKLQIAQHQTVQNTLNIASKRQELEAIQEIEECDQNILKARTASKVALYESELEIADKKKTLDTFQKDAVKDLTAINDMIEDINRSIRQKNSSLEVGVKEKELDILVKGFERKFAAIQPNLIAALEQAGQTDLARSFVEHIPSAGSGIGMLLGSNLIENLIGMVKGTSMEKVLRSVGKDDQVKA